jgi:hypothetical protein
MPSLFQYDQDADLALDEETRKIDLPYRVWFGIAVILTFCAIFSASHFELLAKIAWTSTAPGFTFSQTWKERHSLLSNAAFGALLVVHICLMQVLYPYLPAGHYGYILVAAIVEIMTIGLAYQVWLNLRPR